MTIGRNGFDGLWELNANNLSNGITSVDAEGSFYVGYGGSTDPDIVGTMIVDGNGTPGSAKFTFGDLGVVGAGAQGNLVVKNGGHFVSTATGNDYGWLLVSQGGYENVLPNSVSVDGAGSLIEINRLEVGRDSEVEQRVDITNGGRIYVTPRSDAVDPRDLSSGVYLSSVDASGNNYLTIDGAGSNLTISSGLFSGGGNAAIEVTNGGSITMEDSGVADGYAALYPDSFDEGDFGISIYGVKDTASLLVSGPGSSVDITRDLEIGGFEIWDGTFDAANNPNFALAHGEVTIENGATFTTTRNVEVSDSEDGGTGRLTVASGAILTADTVNVNTGGILDGNGGTIIGDVVLNGGSLAPGASPGTMTIDGNLEIFDGILSLEIGGATPGLFDQLFVTGDLIANSVFDIELDFLNGFTPSGGETFNLLNIAGDSSPLSSGMFNLVTTGLGDGYDVSALFSGGTFSVSVSSDDNTSPPAPVPLPAAFPLLGAGLAGLMAIGRRRRKA